MSDGMRGLAVISDVVLQEFVDILTRRQHQVLKLVCQGMTNREIAENLVIASSVVAGHLTNIYRALADHPVLDICTTPNRYVLVRLFSAFLERG